MLLCLVCLELLVNGLSVFIVMFMLTRRILLLFVVLGGTRLHHENNELYELQRLDDEH
jgi:hypothetical protein